MSTDVWDVSKLETCGDSSLANVDLVSAYARIRGISATPQSCTM